LAYEFQSDQDPNGLNQAAEQLQTAGPDGQGKVSFSPLIGIDPSAVFGVFSHPPQGEHGCPGLAERPALVQEPHILGDPARALLGVGDVVQAIEEGVTR